MDFDKALSILSIQPNFSERDLKLAYYKKALHYHPDKNKDKDATMRFQEIGEAYKLLKKKKTNETLPINFHDILKNCLSFLHSENKWDDIFVDTTLHSILTNCKTISLKVFEKLHNERAIELYKFLLKYKDLFSVTELLLSKIRTIVQKKMNIDNIIVLNPYIDDMLEDSIYKLIIENKDYYIPLWHNELFYDVSGKEVMIKCIPELEKNISMDNDNNIYYIIHDSIQKILTRNKLIFKLGKKVFEIPSIELKISKSQRYTLYKCGIACINTEDIYDIQNRGNIYLDINLH